MAKDPVQATQRRPKPLKLLTLRYTGPADVVVELDGSRHWFRFARRDGRRTKNTHVVDEATWAKLSATPVVAAMLAAGEVTVC